MGDHITIIKPDDFHLHLREGIFMKAVVGDSAKHFGRVIVMPNTVNPIITSEQAVVYKDEIVIASGVKNFTPLMTLYLTDDLDSDEVRSGYESGNVYAVKMYPADVTTNSEYGLTDFFKPDTVYKTMEEIGTPLLIHCELLKKENGEDIDIYDREKEFINVVLVHLLKMYPKLKVVLEHITTEDAVQCIMRDDSGRLSATITPHHLCENRNSLFKENKIHPHMFCLPILKREKHRAALVAAAVSGDRRFFAGTDSAPHLQTDKEGRCGCAGIYNAPVAVSLYAEIFEKENALEHFESFMSKNGADLYGFPYSDEIIKIEKKEWRVPMYLDVNGKDMIEIYRGGEILQWQVVQ